MVTGQIGKERCGEAVKGILVVRKYKNRRLYDTERSRHVTREELLDIVRTGRDVQIQDASNGEDVTVETLLHIMLSDTGGALNAIIPSEFVHFLIRANESGLNRFFRDFLPGAMQTFQAGLRSLRAGHRHFNEALFPYPGLSTASWMRTFGAPSAPQDVDRGDDGSTIDDLQRRLRDLEGELNELRRRS